MRHRTLIVGAGLMALATAGLEAAERFTYRVSASDARVNRRVTGPVTDSVLGVPAEPVDSAVWDGVGSTPVEGFAMLEIDPDANTGMILARWTDEHGEWRYEQSVFMPPPHAAGVRFGTSIETIDIIALGDMDSVTTDVYLHGDTTAGDAFLPTVPTMLATWGPSEVTLDGAPFENFYDGPMPNWVGHTMVTAGVRNDDGTIRTTEDDIFDYSAASDGKVEHGDREFHLVFHDRHGPTTDNLPADFSFFYHVVFEDVLLEVLRRDER